MRTASSTASSCVCVYLCVYVCVCVCVLGCVRGYGLGEDQDVVDAAACHNAADKRGIPSGRRSAGHLGPLLALAAQGEVLLDEQANADAPGVEAAEDVLHVLVLDKFLGDTEAGHLHEAIGDVGLDHAVFLFDVREHFTEAVLECFGFWNWVLRYANK
jgi:hypothetical protein